MKAEVQIPVRRWKGTLCEDHAPPDSLETAIDATGWFIEDYTQELELPLSVEARLLMVNLAANICFKEAKTEADRWTSIVTANSVTRETALWGKPQEAALRELHALRIITMRRKSFREIFGKTVRKLPGLENGFCYVELNFLKPAEVLLKEESLAAANPDWISAQYTMMEQWLR